MSESRSVSRSVSGGTISIDASYAQELLDFWTKKYEQVKGELDQIKETSVAPSSSSRESSYDDDDDDDDDEKGGLSSATENEEESELDTLRACNENLENKLAASEQQRLELLRELRPYLAQNAALAFEADMLRKQKINSIYQPAEFFPADSDPVTFWSSSPRVVLEKLSAHRLPSHPICFVSRPPTCLPLRITTCGQHGYWFSPVTTYPEDVEFELIVEGKATEWTYLGRYRSVHLPGGEMRLSEWLALDDETKGVHCARAAAQRLGQDAVSPATVSATATEFKQQYESGRAAVSCFTLVCTGFTSQMYTALQNVAAQTRKRKFTGQVEGRRIKREAN